jgi:Tol biopolymer transport system component
MGDVYLAHDQKLGRNVALKMLPEEFACDPQRLVRFRREARTLASLNHPNIAAIYGIEESDEQLCLVLELVEGEILRAPLPVENSLNIGYQIAEALHAAHAKGIIHRDLKPANVKVTPEGRVKVLDFGLAKAVWAVEAKREPLPPQNLMDLGTLAGPIVGTAGYMSPEQSRGEEVDQRTDIWAFGCLLYEVLAGKRAFPGMTFQETIDDLRNREPDWNALPAKTPAKIRELLKHCLKKDITDRLPAIADARRIIQEVLHRRSYWAFATAAIVLVAGCTAVALLEMRQPQMSDPAKWVQLTNFPDAVSQPALSPDGKMLAFVRGIGTFYTPGQIYLKSLPDGHLRQLTDDDLEKMSPIFSPDGSQIAYTTVDDYFHWDTWSTLTADGVPKRWLENASGLMWITKGKVLFSELKRGQHMAVVSSNENRTEKRDVYVPAQEIGMAHRSFPSPDRRWVLVAEMSGPWLPCRLVPFDGSSSGRTVGPPGGACTSAAWSPDGKWMFFSSSASGGFHIWRQLLSGGPAQQLTSGPTEQEGIAVAPDGRFLISAVGQRERPLMLHRNDHEEQVTLEGYAYQPKLTANGKFLTYRILKGSQVYTDPTQLWVRNLNSGDSQQLVPALSLFGSEMYDVSSDGSQIIVPARDQLGKSRLWLAPLDGSQPPHQIPGIEGDWPKFGKFNEIYFRSTDGFAYRVHEDGTGLVKVAAEPILRLYSISPDQQWLVMLNGKTILFPLNGGAPIRIEGDFDLQWSPDGRRLYFSRAKEGMSARGSGITYVIPLQQGQMFPRIFLDGPRSVQELANLPGVQIIDAGDVAPGPEPGVYAYSRETTQRNLFRIPIP